MSADTYSQSDVEERVREQVVRMDPVYSTAHIRSHVQRIASRDLDRQVKQEAIARLNQKMRDIRVAGGILDDIESDGECVEEDLIDRAFEIEDEDLFNELLYKIGEDVRDDE